MLVLLQRVLLCLFVLGFASLGQAQPTLPADEVESLRVIARRLGKTDWDFSVDPCSGSSGWVTQNPVRGQENAVTCNCSFSNNTVCHVVSIILKSQNLTGSLPPELNRLPFLQDIDFTRNYLNGTIPVEWGAMNFVNISLIGNRVTGPIPKELGNISTLANLTLEYNQLSGTIPPELGNLSRIERLFVMSNNLSGEIPPELAKLTSIRDFRISDNNFTGRIPDFISQWTNLEKLLIQGSGLSGPIPVGIGSLTKLTDLRISDLSGTESTFPPLSNIRNLENLILRSCNINGTIPDYISGMTTLKLLDLSFNKLTGPIPANFSQLANTADFIYLTGNSLNGPVPAWMFSEGKAIDLSYNNFTDPNQTCQPREVNLFASSKGNTTGTVSCLRNEGCDRNRTSFHINCGGGGVTYGDISYDADTSSAKPSEFRNSNNKWGYSYTGNFIDDNRRDTSIWSTNATISTPNSDLYKDARLSPLSLTYYAFCLMNGNYTVDLHFAEIRFTNDSTFSSLGRRIFDVYIQGELVLKDFNIAQKAGGVNVGIKESFTAVVVDGTLDIRFYWAGKGTNGIPGRGVYGPLISAISVNSNFPPPSENGKNSLSTGAIVGIVFGGIFVIILVLSFLWWRGCLGHKDTLMDDLKGLELHTGIFSLRQIKTATNDFDPANKIGEGGFGPVYKGNLSDGTIIAVKQLSAKSKQGNREFVNEIGMISALQHPHLVKLYGCCIEGNQLLLVYEYMENNSLARALFGPEEHQLHLDWRTRHKICIGIARGLAYLHEESRLKIVHRDIKATNVLLDKDLVPKISDFGLAKLDEEDNTHISTRVAGTYGYMAPEYAMRGHLTDKADVYSFGVVLLEVVCGRSNASVKTKDTSFYLLDWANSLKENGSLLELVDPRLESNYNKKEVITTINLALLCTHVVAAERPSMSTVVSILEGKNTAGLDSVSYSVVSKDKLNYKDNASSYNEEQSIRSDVPWTDSTTASTGDLYPIAVDTDYWQKREH